MKDTKICEICGDIFFSNHPNYKYCSNTCREEAERIRALKYNRKKREEKRKKKLLERKERIGEKGFEYLKKLAEEQQIIIVHKKTYCEACGAKMEDTNLILHHKSYSPQEVVTLCTTCHAILHNSLLRDVKCHKGIINDDDKKTIITKQVDDDN